MNLQELYAQYKEYGFRDTITVPCSTLGCTKIETINKDSAIRNVRQNGVFLCRSCCYTDEGRRRISEATSYKRSDDTRQKMSEAKKAFFQTPAGEEMKKKLSKLTAQGHAENKYENAKRNGWYDSSKSGMVFYGSSYELRLCVELDADDDVAIYRTQISYEKDDRGRCLDFLIEYKDGTKKAVEVKPKLRLNEQENIDQIADSREFAQRMGYGFDVYTEDYFGMTCKELRDWADQFLSNIGEFDWVAFRKEQGNKRSKTYYQKHIAQDKVEVFCEYCNETHTALRLTHDKNIARNGRYICEKEGGHIAGSKPKLSLRKVNPYAAEGKKQCTKCGVIKLFEDFNLDKNRSDGYYNKCRECARKEMNERYERRKK